MHIQTTTRATLGPQNKLIVSYDGSTTISARIGVQEVDVNALTDKKKPSKNSGGEVKRLLQNGIVLNSVYKGGYSGWSAGSDSCRYSEAGMVIKQKIAHRFYGCRSGGRRSLFLL